MNEVSVMFFIWAIIIVGVTVYTILHWYRKKELQELKAVELKILAAEHDLHYTENGAAYLSKLDQIDLQPGSRSKFQNILRSCYGPATIRVFDASHIDSSGNSNKTINLIGVTVESNQLQLPYFLLSRKLALDSFTLFRRVSRIEPIYVPKLIRRNYSLFYRKTEGSHGVENLFSNKDQLHQLLSLLSFHKLAGSKNLLVFYQEGELRSDIAHFRHLEQKGRQLFDMFRIDSTMPDEITILKQASKK